MNPVGEAGNMFSSLFDRVPARRAGNEEDIAGTVIYLASRAGVCYVPSLEAVPRACFKHTTLTQSQAYIDGVSICVDGGRVLVANGQE